jgi:hypothetical protein
MTNSKIATARKGLMGLVLASSVAVLAACSAGAAPLDMSGAAGHGPANSSARTLGDSANGCYQFGQGSNLSQGWECPSYTGSSSTITVPSNATGVQLSLAGGQGGAADPASGGYGTAVTGTWSVSGGQTLTVTVGQGASDATPGGGAASGAKPGGSEAGAGGGASAVELDGSVIAVASGGGGGGAQGMFPGTDDGGEGGTSTVNGGKGHGGSGPGSGDGHNGGNGPALADGTGGGGGHHVGGAGGGGGGGWGGGSGGGGGGWGAGGGAGGAAGGSYVSAAAQAATMAPANAGGDGSVRITWLLS